MKSTYFLLLCICLQSCNYKLVPGKYTDPNVGTITIDEEYNYSFQQSGEDLNIISKGKILLRGNEVIFMPDSSYFFKATVSDYYFDPALKGQKKIILDNTNNVLSRFNFLFQDMNNKEIFFDSIYSSTYNEKEYSLNQIVLHARIKDSVVYWPKPFHSSLNSNSIVFSDINLYDKPWNVLKLKTNINIAMFSFVTIDDYILKKKKLIKKNWPIYTLVK